LTTDLTAPKEEVVYEHHPRGIREVGTCDFIECTEDAEETRYTTSVVKAMAVQVEVCAGHAKALDEGATILLEFRKLGTW
jgi:hypothetical protein